MIIIKHDVLSYCFKEKSPITKDFFAAEAKEATVILISKAAAISNSKVAFVDYVLRLTLETIFTNAN